MDKKLEDAFRALEGELKRVVQHVDQEVVPAARREAHSALKRIAAELDRFADRLGENRKPDEGNTDKQG